MDECSQLLPFLSIRMDRPAPYCRRLRSIWALPRSVPLLAFRASGVRSESFVIALFFARYPPTSFRGHARKGCGVVARSSSLEILSPYPLPHVIA
jgi:hypothetical protein